MRFLFALLSLWPIFTWGNAFRIPYQNELTEINPLNLRSASGAYIHQALFRNLLWINEKNELTTDLAKKCVWTHSRKLTCTLKENLKWSDGSRLTADDFLQTYEFILSPQSPFTRKEMLFTIANARQYAQGAIKSFADVGIRKKNKNAIEYELAEIDPEFEFKLALPMIAPVKQKNFNLDQPLISSGPYRLKSYDTKNLEINLESNPFYHQTNSRPNIAFIYISDDSIQIPMFSKNEIDLVRRIPTAQIPQWKKDPSFLDIEVLRFDYIGFNISKLDKPTRIALAEAIDYSEWQNLLNSVGRPGCYAFSNTALDQPICLKTNKKKTKLTTTRPASFEIAYSHLGGEDHQRTAEWLKSEWKKYLDIEITPMQLENKVFINTLKNSLPAIFRKGVPLETPLCYSAVKIFEPENPENLYHLSDSDLKDKISKLKKEQNKTKQKILCKAIIEHIKSNALIIPTGRYDLSILLRTPYRKLKFNKLNMADFSQY
ncbi:MAG: hypothetical protein JNL11_09135 [Bdellovibrionaceae bacterium]|nr:hypothetical protein [Pseudobdellovibrionaceae bacterium]